MKRRLLAMVALVAVLAMVGAACSSDDNGGGDTTGTTGTTGGGGITVGVSWNNYNEERWAKWDEPAIQDALQAGGAEYISTDAGSSAEQQLTDVENLISQGADALIILAQDGEAILPAVQSALDQGIPVIAYDRLISKAPISYYVSFDNVKVGKIQAQALLDKLGSPDGKQIVMLNGSPTDPSSGDYKKGAHEVLDSSGVKIAKEYDTPDWSPDKAQQETEQAITAVGKDKIAGVYSANDGMVGGAIAAMKSAGMDPKTIATTGQDSEIAAIQRILVDEQYMTIYLAIKKQAESAAELAVDLVKGTQPPASLVNNKVNNGSGDVPTVLLDPTAVTKDNIKDTIIADGFHPASEICTGEFASACTEAGIS